MLRDTIEKKMISYGGRSKGRVGVLKSKREEEDGQFEKILRRT